MNYLLSHERTCKVNHLASDYKEISWSGDEERERRNEEGMEKSGREKECIQEEEEKSALPRWMEHFIFHIMKIFVPLHS